MLNNFIDSMPKKQKGNMGETIEDNGMEFRMDWVGMQGEGWESIMERTTLLIT